MTIRHLRIFVAVVKEGKMGIAAKSLFISQPSVSQAIKEIEDYYGIKLFERLSKKLYITENGQLLFQYAQHILQSFDEMEVNLNHLGEKVNLRIGATITAGTYMLEPMITTFEEQNPQVKIKVIVNNTYILQEMLLNSQLDVGIIEGEVNASDLVKQSVCQDPLVVAVGKKHPLYGQKSLPITALQGHHLICREEGSGIRSLFRRHLEEHQVMMEVKWECTNTEAIKAAAIAGQGIAVFSARTIEQEVKKEILHVIELEGISLSRQICVVSHKDKFLSKQLMSFLDCLRANGLKA